MFHIAVIGAGVIGLSTALEIQKKFKAKARVTIFSEEFTPNTTGDIAAGLWTPYLLGNTPEDKIIQWSKITQDYILDLWQQGKAKETGISLTPIIVICDDKNFKLPEFVKISLGYSELSKKVVDEFSKRHNKNFTNGFVYVSFTWEASKFLPYFQDEFLKNGGQIYKKAIKNFEELSSFDLIVNCTGLQSRFLVPDRSVYPIRGQIARVRAPWQYHTCFIDSDGKGNYIIPNIDCVILGGTYQENNFNTEVDENDKKFILDGCYKCVPALSGTPAIRHQAGLRPGRKTLRLETENRRVGDRILKIVHNYGHGGSGITVSIGCAKEAAQLAKEALKYCKQSKL